MTPSAATLAGTSVTPLVLGLAASWATGRLAGSRRAGAYVALVVLLALPPGPAGSEASPPAARDGVHLLELLLTDLWAGPDAALPLRLQSVLPPPPPSGRLSVGLTALLLATMALLCAGGRLAWGARALLAICLALALGLAGPLPANTLLWTVHGAQVALAVLSGVGLAALGTPESAGRSAAPGLALGTTAVVLTGLLVGLAAWAGSVPPQELLATLELRPQGTEAASLHATESAAGTLVRVLDRAAVVAFAAMVALLLHLRSRNALTLGVVALVTAGELITAWGVPLLHLI